MLARSSLSMFCVILVQLLGLEAEQLREFTDVSEGSDLNEDPRHFIPEKRNKESLKERIQRRIVRQIYAVALLQWSFKPSTAPLTGFGLGCPESIPWPRQLIDLRNTEDD